MTTSPSKPKDQEPAKAADESTEAQPQPQHQGVEIDDSHLTAGYANFCRVSSTPEELILDLGLNPNPFSQGVTKVTASQRIIMNHFTAKRLLHALSAALQRHEQAFGVLEVDVRKRVRGAK